jgi:hypothetical protein
MKKFNYLFTLCAILFGFSINAQTAINDLTDGVTWESPTEVLSGLAGGKFSMILGHATNVGTLNNAYKNTGVGLHTLQDLTTGDANTAFGWGAGRNITTGANSIYFGKEAGKNVTSGGTNTVLGNGAGLTIAGGSNNIIIGAGADADAGGANGQIVIGKSATGVADNTAVIGSASVVGVYMSSDRQAVVSAGAIDLDPATSGDQDVAEITLENDETISNGTDGTVVISGNLSVSSDMRLKDNIESLGNTISEILNLDGKSYTRDGRNEIGLLAQDVELIYPELVSVDRKGMLAVNYQALSAILINGVKDQEARIAKQEERIVKLEILVNLLLNGK